MTLQPALLTQTWLFLSPHLDDAVLSCGGMIYDLVQSGAKVQIITICAGDPAPGPLPPFAASLHQRWQTGREASLIRRQEDEASCRCIQAQPIHLAFQDCIYRFLPDGSPLIQENEALFGPLNPAESSLIDAVSEEIERHIPAGAGIVAPLSLGGHVDHRLVRAAAESLGRPLFYYTDYPYAEQITPAAGSLSKPDWTRIPLPVSAQGLQAWQQAVAEHRSQISTFWGSLADMQEKIRQYCQAGGGGSLWYSAAG